jgi:hypothetical protein
MNGDSYSSRGMASAGSLPRIRKHETDTNNPSTADGGRYGSSRDHYVRFKLDPATENANDMSRHQETNVEGTAAIEMDTVVVEVIGGVRGRLVTVVLGLPAETLR